VHLFTETDCNVYANGPFVALHASQDGSLPLNVGQSKPVTDLLTGQKIGAGPTLTNFPSPRRNAHPQIGP